MSILFREGDAAVRRDAMRVGPELYPNSLDQAAFFWMSPAGEVRSGGAWS
jgi:hypothetical protein